MEQKKIGLSRLSASIMHALSGIRLFVIREQQARIHVAATIAAVILSFILRISRGEWMAVIIVIGLVWIAEMLNTCIEKMMDLISAERRLDIKFIKDVAAGAVLLASSAALVTGLLIFIPKII